MYPVIPVNELNIILTKSSDMNNDEWIPTNY